MKIRGKSSILNFFINVKKSLLPREKIDTELIKEFVDERKCSEPGSLCIHTHTHEHSHTPKRTHSETFKNFSGKVSESTLDRRKKTTANMLLHFFARKHC